MNRPGARPLDRNWTRRQGNGRVKYHSKRGPSFTTGAVQDARKRYSTSFGRGHTSRVSPARHIYSVFPYTTPTPVSAGRAPTVVRTVPEPVVRLERSSGVAYTVATMDTAPRTTRVP